jgi:hypothetical protein
MSVGLLANLELNTFWCKPSTFYESVAVRTWPAFAAIVITLSSPNPHELCLPRGPIALTTDARNAAYLLFSATTYASLTAHYQQEHETDYYDRRSEYKGSGNGCAFYTSTDVIAVGHGHDGIAKTTWGPSLYRWSRSFSGHIKAFSCNHEFSHQHGMLRRYEVTIDNKD